MLNLWYLYTCINKFEQNTPIVCCKPKPIHDEICLKVEAASLQFFSFFIDPFIMRRNEFNSFHTNNFIFIVEIRKKRLIIMNHVMIFAKWTCHTNLMNQLTYKCNEKACGIIIFQLKQVIQTIKLNEHVKPISKSNAKKPIHVTHS